MDVKLGTYGNFEIMPLLCPGGFDTCTTTLESRERLRKPNTDGHIVFCISISFGFLISFYQMLHPDISRRRSITT